MAESLVDLVDEMLDAAARLSTGSAAQQIPVLRGFLHAPPRVVVAGRVGSGKSTLVNALIGSTVAATSALETTSEPTVYVDGAPERTERLDDGRPTMLRCHLPSAALRELELLDTPGLSTLTADYDSAARDALTVHALHTHADAAVFLCDNDLRSDEIDILNRWSFTALTAVGVLSRSDTFGSGAFGDVDPIDAARADAQRLQKVTKGMFSAVIPVAGLLAQTARCGQVTEDGARAIAALASADKWAIADRFDDPSIDADDRELLRRFAAYGLVRGREVAAAGAGRLTDWLDERSGLGALRAELLRVVDIFAVPQRVSVILAHIEYESTTHPDPAALRSLLLALRSKPQMLAVRLLEDHRRLAGQNRHSALLAASATMLAGDSIGERFGLSGTASSAEICAAAESLLDDLAATGIAGMTGAEEALAATMTRLCRRTIEEVGA